MDIKNVREYKLSKELILESYNEAEYLDNKLRYEDKGKVLNTDGAKIVESTASEFNQQANNKNVNRKLVLSPN